MKPDDFSNVWYLFAILTASFLIGLYALRKSKFQKRKKTAELVSLGIAVLVLFGLLGQNRIYMAKTEQNLFQMSAAGEASFFNIKLNSSWACMPSVRSEFSPKDFDEIVSAKKDLCEWKKIALDDFNNISLDTYPTLPKSIEEDYPESARTHFQYDFLELQKGIDRYNSVRDEFYELKSKAKKSIFEILLDLYAPFLLAVATGFTAAKIIREPS